MLTESDRHGIGERLDRVPATGLVVAGIFSVQFGAAIAVTAFHRAGPSGVVLLRLTFASLILLGVSRPRLRALTRERLPLVAAFGVVLGVMNLAFYAAISRIPLGIGVAIEFLGPLGVAIAGSRRRVDLAWVVMAAAGVLALSRGGAHGLNLLGVMLALLAGAAWATYILLNARIGRAFSDGSGLALAMCLAALLALPFGVHNGAGRLLHAHVILIGAAVGLLSSAIPYSLEMKALRRISPAVFGVLMSLEPAVAALAGFLIIAQQLSLRELLGIALVILASAGASLHARQDAPVAPQG